MREIKFRGIDIKTRKFVYGSLVNFSELNDCPQYEIYSIEKITKQQKWYKVYDVGQYTGLKDKNGVEIYEGDIIQRGFMKAKIIFGYCGFELEWLTPRVATIRNRKNEPIFSNVSLIFKVVGNIYENPELLEVKQ